MTGFCYAIGDGNGLVKIGWSADPARRLTKIQADNGAACTLLGVVSSTREQEADLLDLLSPWCERGEWFKRGSKAVECFISSLRPYAPQSKRRRGPGNNALDRFIIERGMTNFAFGAVVGRSAATISRWRRSLVPPNWASIGRIRVFTKNAVTEADFAPMAAEPDPAPSEPEAASAS